MLSRERFELYVGTVFILAMALLVLGVVWAKQFRAATPEMRIEARFPAVGGLLKGDVVSVSGLRMGEVSDVDLRDGEILVTIELDRAVGLYDDYALRIVLMNFTGEMGVNISPGSGEPLPKPYGVLRGTAPLDVAALAAPAMDALGAIREIADTLRVVLPPLVTQTSGALSRLDTVLAATSNDVSATRFALTGTLREMRSTVRTTREVLGALQSRIDTSATNADAMFASLTATSDSVRNAMARMDSSRGTLHRLVTDSTLYARLLGATTSLDSAATSLVSLAADVRENPGRYVKFSLF